ncbi:jg27735 [Pararge aegeria aegeria]|uniref:Jg27735 protein n=1 Tax=Pararge aegeria aegeria TaxID=348720 RepID=A0A8S4S451_9NEOP|nr:jg27735 [Pararge aegeria aegeria]
MNQSLCRLCNENIGDDLPANICAFCEEQLGCTYSFVLKCEDTDKKLRSLQLTVKHECEIKYDVKTEDSHTTSPDDIFDNPSECYDSPLIDNIKEEIDFGIQKKTKRKYVRTKPRKASLSKCKVCGRVCNSPSSLAIHMRSHTNEKPYGCLLCDKKYKDSGTLKRHAERNHNNERARRFICEHCGKGFYSKSDCKIHMRTHTGETPYSCSSCPARFSQVGSLQRHKLTHTGERTHVCTKCPKKFPTREELKKHYLVHSDERKHKCPLCEIQFKSSNNMRKHFRMHTDKMNKFICNYCKRCFPFKGNLQCHITKQHSSKSGHCEMCSKYFPNIKLHMLKHAGMRTVKCELCPSSFFDLKGLSTHVNFRHKFADKYKCTINDCTLKFPSQPMLDYHVMRYHKSMKPFVCDKCPRSFYRKSDMVRHKKGTHKEYMAGDEKKIYGTWS